MHMKITGFGSISSNSGVNKRRNASGVGGFSDLLSASEAGEAAETGGASHVSDVAAASGLHNLLALQEISEEDMHRRKAVSQGHSMLDSLEKLRRQILGGTVPAGTLADISRQLSMQKQHIIDPGLMAIIEDIELRTAVELAKLEMAAARVATPDL